MSRYYRRLTPDGRDNVQAGLVAGLVAAAAAVMSFYVVRIFLAREPLEPLEMAVSEVDSPDDSRQDPA